MRLSIVSTLYQSAPHLEEFVARASRAAAALGDDYEIILVNDGSPDRSREIALALFERDPHLRIIDLARNFGHHRALMTGLAHVRGDLVFLIDSDLEEEPELLGPFLETMHSTRADVVYGVQAARRGGLGERFSGWLFFKVFNLLSDWPIPRNVITLRLMTRAYVDALVSHRERETMIAGLWVMTGFRQVAQEVKKHAGASSTYSLAHKLAILVNSITSFSDRPLVLIFYLGLIIITLASTAAGYLVIRRLFFGALLAGWPSLIVSVWLLGGLTLSCLGVVGIYVSKVFLETKGRPYTIIRGVYERAGNEREVRGDSADSRRVLL